MTRIRLFKTLRIIASFSLAGTVIIGIIDISEPFDMHVVGMVTGTLLGITFVINKALGNRS